VGSIIVFTGPRLVADRLDEPPEVPPRSSLVPLIGTRKIQGNRWHALGLELGTAVVLAGLAFRYGDSIKLAFAAVYSVLLLAIAYVDIGYRLVLNRLSYPGMVLALAASSLWPGIGPLSALLGAIVGLLLFAALQLLGRGAMGTGDTKLALLIGAMRGFPGVFDSLLLGVILGGLAAVFAMVVLRRGRKSFIAYAPYLACGAILSFFLVPH
jgi:leader peptidase (prepilin peptidase) / N-methyltransferase